MTFEEFLAFREVKIKNPGHERIVRLFYPYMASVSGDSRLLPALIGRLLEIDLSDAYAQTGCFNGAADKAESPSCDADLYIKFDNGVRVCVYGSPPKSGYVPPGCGEYLLIMSDGDAEKILREENSRIRFFKAADI